MEEEFRDELVKVGSVQDINGLVCYAKDLDYPVAQGLSGLRVHNHHPGNLLKCRFLGLTINDSDRSKLPIILSQVWYIILTFWYTYMFL